jgi:hypothetical protein
MPNSSGITPGNAMTATRWDFDTFANLELTQHVVRKFVDSGTAGRVVILSSVGGLLTAYGLGACCATKHALEAIASTLRAELEPTDITVQTINPGPYLTGFNDRIADTTYRWQDDEVNFNRRADIKAHFAEIMEGQFDPQDMIDKIVAVIGADDGLYRNVWPAATEEFIKPTQQEDWDVPSVRSHPSPPRTSTNWLSPRQTAETKSSSRALSTVPPAQARGPDRRAKHLSIVQPLDRRGTQGLRKLVFGSR